ncbi:MAG: hypothetical protein ACE5Z5_08990 [Candidatus Bathyarchaeia archaeon]
MTSLMKVFGGKAQTKLLQYMLEHPNRVFNQTGLAHFLDCSPSTVARVIAPLVEEGIIVCEQVSGQMKIIALNPESEKARVLMGFYEAFKRL